MKKKQQFRVIVSDPPWNFSDSLKMSDVKRGAAANYSTMTMQDIKNLNVKELADPDGCILALWVPSSLLQDGLDTMKAWGFNQKQTYIWVKTKKQPFLSTKHHFVAAIEKNLPTKGSTISSIKSLWKSSIKAVLDKLDSYDLDILGFGMGRLFRQTHEICLIGTNNNKIYKHLKNKSQRSVSLDVNLRHSAKPDILQNALEAMFPDCDRLEMFARRHRANWICVGNEICNGEDITKSIQNLLGT